MSPFRRRCNGARGDRPASSTILTDCEPVWFTDDTTIAIYRTADLRRPVSAERRSVNVAAPRQPIFQAIGQLGHAPHQPLGIDRLDRVDRDVFDHDEVLLATQDAHREVSVDEASVELEQGAAIAIVDRPADRDESHDRAPLGIGAGRPDVDRLLAIEPQGNDELPAPSERVGFVERVCFTNSVMSRLTSGSAGSGISYGPRASLPASRRAATPPWADRKPGNTGPRRDWPACSVAQTIVTIRMALGLLGRDRRSATAIGSGHFSSTLIVFKIASKSGRILVIVLSGPIILMT